MRRVVALSWFALCALLLLLSGWPAKVSAKRERASELPTLPAALRKSRSLGYPWQGKLERGVKLRETGSVRYVTEYGVTNHFFGAWQLVQLLERAAHQVARSLPGARLSVGELSKERGGDLPGHASHESGRDVDVGFYMLDAASRSYSAYAFARFGERGQGLLRGLVLRAGAIDPRAALNRAREHGVLLTIAGGRVLRFTPPLVVTEAELSEGVAKLDAALASFA